MYRSSNLQQISTPQQKINKQKILTFPTFLPPVNFIQTVMVLWSYVKLYVHLWLLFTQKIGFSYQFAAAIFLLHKTDKSQQLCQCSLEFKTGQISCLLAEPYVSNTSWVIDCKAHCCCRRCYEENQRLCSWSECRSTSTRFCLFNKVICDLG